MGANFPSTDLVHQLAVSLHAVGADLAIEPRLVVLLAAPHLHLEPCLPEPRVLALDEVVVIIFLLLGVVLCGSQKHG